MIANIRLAEIGQHEDREVSVSCWLFNLRSKGRIRFLQLRDGSARVQAVAVADECDSASFARISQLKMEASLTVRGRVRRDDRSLGGYELGLSSLEVIHNPAVDYPIAKKDHGVDFLLEHRHLWLRSRRPEAALKVRSACVTGLRGFFEERGFVLVDTPILTGAVGENAGTLFTVPYFDLGDAYLAQTGQLYLEAACFSLSRVYNFGPTFRAEKSKTRRHLTEFWMLEAEMAFCDNQQSMDLQEQMICHVVNHVLKRCHVELAELGRDTSALAAVKAPFPRIEYDDAIARLQRQGSHIQWGDDLGAEDETLLASGYGLPLFVTNYPAAVKAFYMKQAPGDPARVLCSDLLAPDGYGEIIGGSQREDDLGKLTSRIVAEKLPLDAYGWYLDLRRYGSVPHSGFGLGLERLVAWLTGIAHVREAIPFPRTIGRLTP